MKYKSIYQVLLAVITSVITILLFPNAPLMILGAMFFFFSIIWMAFIVIDLYQKDKWLEIIMTISANAIIFSVFALLSCNMFNKSYKTDTFITDKKTLLDLHLLIANYEQTYYPILDNKEVQCDLLVGYSCTYPYITNKTVVKVHPNYYNFIVNPKGSDIGELLSWEKEKYWIEECTYASINCSSNQDTAPITMGYSQKGNAKHVIPEKVILHIKDCQSQEIVDSIVFQMAKKYDTVKFPKDSSSFEIRQKRSSIEIIKDRFLID